MTQADQTGMRSRARRITISDVSEALGLTKSTVSRALNGYPDISDATRLRVTRMAERMGYRPLSQAQGMKTGRTRSLGLVVQMSEHDAHRPFLAEFLAGISWVASRKGWTLTVATSDSEEATHQTFRALVSDRKADGFILPRTMISDPRIDLLRDMEVPFVLFGRTGDDRDCAWFDILGEDAMRDAVLHLARLGHQRIGFVNGGARYNYSLLRHAGFLQGMDMAGLTVDPALMAANAVDEDDGANAVRHMLQTRQPPTAIVFALDRAALGLYRVAADLGLQVGQALSVISYDGTLEGAAATPPLSTFAVDIRLAGERLADLLINRIRGDAPEDLRETRQAQFLDRGSAGPPALSPDQLHAVVSDALIRRENPREERQ